MGLPRCPHTHGSQRCCRHCSVATEARQQRRRTRPATLTQSRACSYSAALNLVLGEIAQEGKTVPEWLLARGGRVFTELHLASAQAASLNALRKQAASDEWRQAGCSLFTFTLLRCVPVSPTVPDFGKP